VRAVNHRFLDVQLRIPSSFGDLEPRVRALLQKRLARGRVELGISVQLRHTAIPTVELNEDFANALSAALDRARERGLVTGQLTPGDLLRMPQAISVRERQIEPDPAVEAQLGASVERAVEQALADLDAMRTREGTHLRADLDARKRLLAELIARLARAADEGRVSDISEEVTRFRAHLAHWDALTDADEPCGRKLDFLLQEMNREVNTIGAKADGLGVSEVIIAAKAELEKMREQVQNVE